MKNMTMRISQIILAILPMASLWGQDGTISLHLSPDIYATKVDAISPDDSRLGKASPVLDEAKAALGWQFADFKGTLEGYVPDAKIGKDLLPVDDTLIRAKPAEGSDVLGVYKFGDAIEVVDTGLWWKIRVETTFPVYFVADTPAPLPPVTGTSDEAPLALVDEPPVPLIEQSPLSDEAAVATTGVTSAVYQQPKQSNRPEIVGQSYAGVFRQAKHRFGLFKPKATYYLEGADGKRIAWVNVQETVIPGTINTFIDQPVIVYGERTLLPKSRDWMIHARNIRSN